MNPRTQSTRRRTFTCLLVAPLLASLSGCAFMTEMWDDMNRMLQPNQLAASDFDPRPYASTAVVTQSAVEGASDNMQSLAEGVFNAELKRHGYTLTTRSNLDKAFEETAFQRSGLTNGQIAEVGRIAAVPGIIIVTIVNASVGETRSINGDSSAQTRVTVRSELLDVETAEIMWTETKEGTSSGRDSFGRATREAAEWLAQRIPTLRPTVHFRSDPRGAQLRINGEVAGTTPHMIKLDSLDDIEVSFTRSGYETYTEIISPADGMKFEADMKLAVTKPAPAPAPEPEAETETSITQAEVPASE